MKKVNKFALLILLTSISFVIFTACGKLEFKVQFIVDDEICHTINTSGEETIEMPSDPSKENYTFAGWYWDNDSFLNPFTTDSLLDKKLTSNMSVYARWNYGTEGLEFIDVNGSYSVLKYTGSEKHVIIPRTHLGVEVKYISNSAFKDTGIISIEIPDSVVSMGSSIFSGCSNLKEITTPFVGEAGEANDMNALLGYFFGTTSFLGGVSTRQDYASNLYIYYYMPMSLEKVVITNAPNIHYGAFSNCNYLKCVEVGNVTTSISESVFNGCSVLTSITIPSMTALPDGLFYKIFGSSSSSIPNSLKAVVITGGTSIGNNAFQNCSNLTSITIPSSVTSIGNNAFQFCSSLTSVNITDLSAWCGISFSGYLSNPLPYAKLLYLNGEIVTDLTIPSSVTSIKSYAFYNCDSLISITIPASVTSIGNAAFYNCSSLTSITIPNSVTSIGLGAFQGCNALTSITIPFVGATLNGTSNTHFGYIFGGTSNYHNSSYVPSSLETVIITGGTSIISSVFYNCSSLTSITIPSSVTFIGNSAFSGCNGVASITVDSENTVYKSEGNCLIRREDNKLILGCKNSIIPSSVTSIGDSAFSNCSSLTSITIPSSVTSIGNYAFNGCSGLTSVTIESGVTSIGDYAFSNCSSLTSITIPSSVTSIGLGAFKGCNALTSITIPFVGESRTATGLIGVFGYIFGSSQRNVTGTTQQYYSLSDYYFYYIPTSLRTVIITDATQISYGAFYNCSLLTGISINSETQSNVGLEAFYDCVTPTYY